MKLLSVSVAGPSQRVEVLESDQSCPIVVLISSSSIVAKVWPKRSGLKGQSALASVLGERRSNLAGSPQPRIEDPRKVPSSPPSWPLSLSRPKSRPRRPPTWIAQRPEMAGRMSRPPDRRSEQPHEKKKGSPSRSPLRSIPLPILTLAGITRIMRGRA